MGSRSLENRSVVDEIKCSQGGTFLYDFGHPLLNRVADSFIKAAGIGALQSVSREAYFTVAGSLDSDNGPPPELSSARKRHVPGLKGTRSFFRIELCLSTSKFVTKSSLLGETNKESLEAMVKSVGQESIQWGLAAGVYSGLTYGLKEARGAHDWNSAIAGAVTGVAVALASDDSSHERIVQSAITGAAVSAAANIFAGIF